MTLRKAAPKYQPHPINVPSRVRIRFYNASPRDYPTFEEAEQAIRASQWNTYWDQEHFRQDMADRALAWSGVEMDIDGTSKDFLYEMERAQLLTMSLFYDHLTSLGGNVTL